jgi:hypothetical protein
VLINLRNFTNADVKDRPASRPQDFVPSRDLEDLLTQRCGTDGDATSIKVWSLMQLERQLRPQATAASEVATSPAGGSGPAIPEPHQELLAGIAVFLQRLPWPAPYQAWVINAMAAVESWWCRDEWRYNIVSAARPVSDRDTVRSMARWRHQRRGAWRSGLVCGEVEVETWDASGPGATCGPMAGRRPGRCRAAHD